MKKMSHLPFLKALDEYPKGGPAWEALGLGWLVLRVFDDWLRIGPERAKADLESSDHFQQLSKLPDGYQGERWVLEAALHMMTDKKRSDPGPVVAPLLAYGSLLEIRDHWGPAADVYETVVAALESPQAKLDFKSIASALMRAGVCWARAQEFDRAVEAYTLARKYAADTNDHSLHIQARARLANISRDRGDLPAAEHALDELLEDVSGLAPHVIALTQPWILHCRGAVRQARGRYTEAIEDYYAAYKDTLDPFARELILTDLGGCASVAGCRNMARNALEIITLSTRYPLANQFATVNLIEIAVLDGDRIAFERWRNAWRPEQANPLTNAYARLYVARGIERFVDREAGIAAFAEVAEYAENAKIHQVQFEALEDLNRLQEMKVLEARKVAVVPPSLKEVDEALTELREFVELQK